MQLLGFQKSVPGVFLVFLLAMTFVEGKNFFKIRPRDETGHRTGLGTIAKSFIRHPIDTVKSMNDFRKSYSDMRTANIRGGNLNAHEKANYDATKRMGNPRLAEGISAVREQYKNVRFTTKYNKGPARKGYGDMRTPQEVKNTMAANRRGRDRAMAEMKGFGF